MTISFAQLGLPDPLVRTLAKRGIVEPFPVQEAAIPDALLGRDICGKAPTGSGKTLAFGLPLLATVEKASSRRPRSMILAPTRELAEQIKKELVPLASAAGRRVLAVYGGVGYGPQKTSLRQGVDVLVATPGRLEDLIEQGSVDLGDVEIVVIDEADRMADMGFLPAVRRILDRTSRRRQTLLFSATLDGDVAVLSRDYQKDPARHEAGSVETETIDAQHFFWSVQHHDRAQHAADVIDAAGRSIVFTRTRHGADRLAKQVSRLGISAVAIHGGRSQNQRNAAIRSFSSGRVQALIATDVAARGIHIDAVASVVHFDPPADAKDYLHRSGRTARAGAGGTVVSFVTGDQKRGVRRIQKDLGLTGDIEDPRVEAIGSGPGGDRSEARSRRPVDSSTTRPPRRAESPTRPAGKDGRQSVYVSNLPWSATDDDLRGLFERYGEVHQTTIITDRRSGRSKGFGFVDMNDGDVLSAIEALHGSAMAGRDLTVRLARPSRYSDHTG